MAVIQGRRLAVAGAIAALSFTGASFAQPGGMHGPPGMQGAGGPAGASMIPPPMMHYLQLDRSQAKKVTKLQREFAQQQAERASKMRELRWKLDKAVAQPGPDGDKVAKLFDKLSSKRKKMLMSQIETRNKVLDVLNDEQTKRYKAIQKRRMGMPPGNDEAGEKEDDD